MDRYEQILSALFVRFPSVSKEGFSPAAYKPGLDHMRDFDALLGHPAEALRTVHVAGTNGKGSVSSMLASALSARGWRVGLFTSPHLLDFRERIKIVGPEGFRMIAREEVLSFVERWSADFDRLSLSFFEITTGLAFDWFAREEVDIAVIEVGLGGRLDSTNILTPELAVVTSIGLDHCAQLGDSRAAIAGEKAGIFKPGVPALVGERDAETAVVFEAAAAAAPCPLFFADEFCEALSAGGCVFRGAGDLTPSGECPPKNTASGLQRSDPSGERHPETTASGLKGFDLRGEYQFKNLRTVLAALELLGVEPDWEALAHTAMRTGLRGRWETLRERPLTLCDIGHNPAALRENFAQLREMMASGRYRRLHVVYGIMADKALDDILPLMPREAVWWFVTPATPRALPAAEIAARFRAFCQGSPLLPPSGGPDAALPGSAEAASAVPPAANVCGNVANALRKVEEIAAPGDLIYIGGSTFVVSEAISYFETR